MWYASAALFLVGFLAYVAALFNMGSSTGETLSDVGNACLLTGVALSLLWAGRPWASSSSRGGNATA